MKRWPTKPLGEVCFTKSGNSKIIKGKLSTHNDGNLFPAYSATGQDVFSDGFDFEGDGIVISAVGARCGKCFLANGKWRAIANTHVVLPKPDKANIRFLWYLLNDESFWVRGGTAQPFVKVGDSLKKHIAVPPLAEQERIVKLLDEADELRKLRAQADSRTAALLPALFHEMFGDAANNENNWPVVQLNEIISRITNGYVGPTRDIYQESGVPYILSRHIDNNLVHFDGRTFISSEFNQRNAKSILRAGDVLLVQTGHVGEAAVVPEKHEGHNCHAIIVMSPVPEKLIGEYLCFWLTSTSGRCLDHMA